MGLCATQILGLPISAEYTVGGASVVRQDYERGSLIWDERQAEPWKCYFSAVGMEQAALHQQMGDLPVQVNGLKAALAQAQATATRPASPPAQTCPSADEIAAATMQALAATLAAR